MKWQTCQTQNLVGGNARVGSSPTAGTLQQPPFSNAIFCSARPDFHSCVRYRTVPLPIPCEHEPFEEEPTMRVKNLNKGALGNSSSGSWLTHWERHTGQNAWMCYVQGCIGRPTAGGRIQKDSLVDRNWYVIPLCADCSERSGQDLDIWDEATLVSAMESEAMVIHNAPGRNRSRWAPQPAPAQ